MNDKELILLKSEDKLMRMVGELALNLHLNYSRELSGDLPAETPLPLQKETSDYLINGNTIRFSSIEALNRTVASYLFDKNQNAFESDSRMWLSTAHDLWRHEIGKADSAAGRLLALVHEFHDVFSIAANAIENGSMKVFAALGTIVTAFTYLKKLEIDNIFKLCAAQHKLTKNDLNAGMFFGKLEKLLATQPEICHLIHARLMADITEATANLHSTALLALAKSFPEQTVKLAREDAESSNAILKRAGLYTLGRLLAPLQIAEDVIPAVSTTIIANMSDPVKEIRQTAINAAAQAIAIINNFDEILTNLAGSGDQDTLAAIAYILMIHIQEMKSKANFCKWIQLLRKLSPLSTGAIDYYDQVLSQLISDESQQQFVISCFSEWAIANAKDMPRDKSIGKIFNATVSELANRRELLSQVITDWFLYNNKQLAFVAAGLLSHLWVHGFKDPEFSISRLDALKQSDLLFLARRLFGFISAEEHLISLTMSFLKTKDAPRRTFGIVHSLLVDELGQNYPVSTVNALGIAKSSVTEPEWITFYSVVIDEITSRMNELEALPYLAELRPPPSLERQFAMARAKQMSETAEEIQKNSIIRQMVTEIPIKAGHGWFSFKDGSYTETSHMHSLSHSISVPRRYVLDTVGYDLSRFFLRLAKREETCD